MHKCYTFLIFMVLLLPSLGLSRWVSEEGVGAGVGDGKKGSSQGLQSRGYSLVVCGLFLAVASLVVEHRLRSCGTQA